MKLLFGVLDMPYADAASYRTAKVRRPKRRAEGSATTGDVATILEDQYGIMDVFWEKHGDEIGNDIMDALEGSLESALMGAPVGADPYATAMSKTEEKFKEFLSSREVEHVGLLGVPTQAALDGHSKRFKHPYAKRQSRPSFIDTGLYQASFKAWVED